MFRIKNNTKLKRKYLEKLIFLPAVLAAVLKGVQLLMKKKLIFYFERFNLINN